VCVINIAVERLTLLIRIRYGRGLEFRPSGRLTIPNFAVIFLSPSRKIPAQYPTVGHESSFPRPSQFLFH